MQRIARLCNDSTDRFLQQALSRCPCESIRCPLIGPLAERDQSFTTGVSYSQTTGHELTYGLDLHSGSVAWFVLMLTENHHESTKYRRHERAFSYPRHAFFAFFARVMPGKGQEKATASHGYGPPGNNQPADGTGDDRPPDFPGTRNQGKRSLRPFAQHCSLPRGSGKEIDGASLFLHGLRPCLQRPKAMVSPRSLPQMQKRAHSRTEVSCRQVLIPETTALQDKATIRQE